MVEAKKGKPSTRQRMRFLRNPRCEPSTPSAVFLYCLTKKVSPVDVDSTKCWLMQHESIRGVGSLGGRFSNPTHCNLSLSLGSQRSNEPMRWPPDPGIRNIEVESQEEVAGGKWDLHTVHRGLDRHGEAGFHRDYDRKTLMVDKV
ncbi:hypothetical protein HID58_046313 [Brassica napus]|uniref:Uncharacterized protein n=1 Tax=Brassica napus TaxID=3708 RepID=A0ABQ8AW26_BRANA|nr:hypothetical protein HID58_046313 [Brassica napus]